MVSLRLIRPSRSVREFRSFRQRRRHEDTREMIASASPPAPRVLTQTRVLAAADEVAQRDRSLTPVAIALTVRPRTLRIPFRGPQVRMRRQGLVGSGRRIRPAISNGVNVHSITSTMLLGLAGRAKIKNDASACPARSRTGRALRRRPVRGNHWAFDGVTKLGFPTDGAPNNAAGIWRNGCVDGVLGITPCAERRRAPADARPERGGHGMPRQRAMTGPPDIR
jgi:hypothetical protein